MKTLIFDFSNAAQQQKTLTKISQLFQRAGCVVTSSFIDTTLSRTSGIAWRGVHLSFNDSQKVSMRVKATGDIYQVLINDKVRPLREQDDAAKAITEIGAALDAGRSSWQKRLAAVRTREQTDGARAVVSRVMEIRRVGSAIEEKKRLLTEGNEELAELHRQRDEALAA